MASPRGIGGANATGGCALTDISARVEELARRNREIQQVISRSWEPGNRAVVVPEKHIIETQMIPPPPSMPVPIDVTAGPLLLPVGACRGGLDTTTFCTMPIQVDPTPRNGVSEQALGVGGVAEVYSATAKRWFTGLVTAESPDKQMLTVHFVNAGAMQQKSLPPSNPQLAPFGTHERGIPHGFLVAPSTSRPGQVSYVDMSTGVKYGTLCLAWRIHLERLLQSLMNGPPTVTEDSSSESKSFSWSGAMAAVSPPAPPAASPSVALPSPADSSPHGGDRAAGLVELVSVQDSPAIFGNVDSCKHRQVGKEKQNDVKSDPVVSSPQSSIERKAWNVGSVVEVHSGKLNRWCLGLVSAFRNDIEMLTVQYVSGGVVLETAMHCSDPELAPLRSHVFDLPLGFEEVRSAHESTHICFVDTSTGEMYSSLEPVWRDRLKQRIQALRNGAHIDSENSDLDMEKECSTLFAAGSTSCQGDFLYEMPVHQNQAASADHIGASDCEADAVPHFGFEEKVLPAYVIQPPKADPFKRVAELEGALQMSRDYVKYLEGALHEQSEVEQTPKGTPTATPTATSEIVRTSLGSTDGEAQKQPLSLGRAVVARDAQAAARDRGPSQRRGFRPDQPRTPRRSFDSRDVQKCVDGMRRGASPSIRSSQLGRNGRSPTPIGRNARSPSVKVRTPTGNSDTREASAAELFALAQMRRREASDREASVPAVKIFPDSTARPRLSSQPPRRTGPPSPANPWQTVYRRDFRAGANAVAA